MDVATESRNDLKIKSLIKNINSVIIDKEEEVHLCLVAVLCEGHVLLEGAPGMGKTSLVRSVVHSLGLENSRIQFTNDMLPADIIGASLFDASTAEFRFHRGPIFSNFVLADEINRATPKTQSACLQAMEEGRVDIDGKSYDLPKPFFVFATQNPSESIGTFPLPESQLDRFFMKIQIGLPSRNGERELLLKGDPAQKIGDLPVLYDADSLLALMKEIDRQHVSESILDYVLDIIEKSRSMSTGLSPRASQDLLRAAKASSFLEGRDFVSPEDVQRVAVAVMNHRLGEEVGSSFGDSNELAKEILNSISVA